MLCISGRHLRPLSFVQLSNLATDVTIQPPEPKLSTINSAQYKRGTGGRSSFSGNVVTLFGSTGVIGERVLNRLVKRGDQVIIPYRCDPSFIRGHKVLGDLGQILFYPFQLNDEDSIRRAVKYSNTVINLIGTRYETKNYNLFDTNEHGARRIARISREMGVQRLIHVSALNASENPEPALIPGGSNFLRSKYRGELAVREEYPDATIVRPSVMFASPDAFITFYVGRFRKTYYDLVYFYKAGEQTYKMPVYLGDVTLGLAKLINDPTSAGKTYEFVGPHCYKMSEMMDFLYAHAHCVEQLGYRYRRHGFYYEPLFQVHLALTNLYTKVFRKKTPLIKEWMEFVEGTNDVLTGCPTLKDLGITRLTELEHMGASLALHRNFKGEKRFKYGELPTPPLPLRSPPLIQGQFDPKDLKGKPFSLNLF